MNTSSFRTRMTVGRILFERYYDSVKPLIFHQTADNPQKAHETFLRFCQFVYQAKAYRLLFNHQDNDSSLTISNAAGFNKNGEFPPCVLKEIGFNRIVIGTVTYDSWLGNPIPNIKRFPQTESMVNWMGLPGIGAQEVAKKLRSFPSSSVPITINLMSTPGKKGDDFLQDLQGTILALKDLPSIDRFELNISCPNTHASSGKIDARKENLQQLEAMLSVVESTINPSQKIFLKVSPDSTPQDVEDISTISAQHRVSGFVTANTTTVHDRQCIPTSPSKDGQQIGGASGNAVYSRSLLTQQRFVQKKKELQKDWIIIACGGINSVSRLKERLDNGAKEVQIFTPFIYSGPKLLRQFHQYQKTDDQNKSDHNNSDHNNSDHNKKSTPSGYG